MDTKDLYKHRMTPFFDKESYGDFLLRIARAKRRGDVEANVPLKTKIAENLILGNATKFVKLLTRLGLRFNLIKEKDKDSFHIEAA